MIADTLDNLHRYLSLSPHLPQAAGFLETTDLDTLTPGRYPISGDNSYLLIFEYTTKPAAEAVCETHRKYLDIHIVLKGREKMGWALLDDQEISEAYNLQKDAAFYRADLDYLTLIPGMFFLALPTDIHAPSVMDLEPKTVRKAVLKVRV